MKKSILGLTLIGCLSLSFANDGEQSKNNKVSQEEKQVKIQERKSKILERINERISKLEKAKSCINSAKTHDELKQCKTEHKNNSKDGE